MALVETETLLVGTSRTVRVTLYEEDGTQKAASSFRARLFKPNATEEVAVLAPEPGTTSLYKYSLNFIAVGKWTLRRESDSPDATWEKVWTVLASRAPSPN